MEKGIDSSLYEQSNKRIRVSSSYTQELYDKLDRLACAVSLSPTSLQTLIIDMALNNENIIDWVQQKRKRRARFRIIPTRLADGTLHFVFAEKLRK